MPGRDANVEIERERLRQRLQHGRALSYEVVLKPEHGFAYLATLVAPRLAEYLGNKKWSPLHCPGVFVSLFVDEDLYLIDAMTFFDVVREAEGLSDAAWRERLRIWQRGG